MSETGLRLRGVAKRFATTTVLHGLDVDIAAGTFATLLGPSGCGKTTLLRIIAGLEGADAGSVHLDGVDLSREPANRRPVNTVFQSYALFPHLDVFENIAFGLRARGLHDEVATRLAETCELLRIGDLARRRVHQLSGGQRQRVALARALVNRPRLLLLDEPLSALDAQLRAEVQLELRRVQRRLGTTFLLVTHDQDEAMTVSDRILVMDRGAIVQDGAPQAVYERPATRFVAAFLGAANLIPGRRAETAVATALGVLDVAAPPAWNAGTLAIRPERIAVATTAPPTNGVEVTVRDVVYRGDHCDLLCAPCALTGEAATDLRARVPPTTPVAPGDRLWLHLPVEHLRPLAD